MQTITPDKSHQKKQHGETPPLNIALLGNPNTGKTTLFNALTGYKARVGNYSGVTIERREGPLKGVDRQVTLIDLPGTYSLAAHSPDEMVAVKVLLGLGDGDTRPDAVVVVIDASNIERNLFLTTQVLELSIPTIVVLNMTDLAVENGLEIDEKALSRVLGVPVLPVVARTRKGIEQLSDTILACESLKPPEPPQVYSKDLLLERNRLIEEFRSLGLKEVLQGPFLVSRPLVEVDGMVEKALITAGGQGACNAIEGARQRLAANKFQVQAYEATERYRWIRENCSPAIHEKENPKANSSRTDRIDNFLTHRFFGTLTLLILMTTMFQAIYSWSGPLMDLIDGSIGWVGEYITSITSPGPLQSFLVDGVITGVGGILIFLPQICVLFLFIALLEDIGYMARAAYLMDRLLSRVGLSGRSFIPMLSSFACAVPGVMAARSIENRSDRIATILVAPLMSCSARLPVYTLFIAAFVPNQPILGFLNLQGIVLLSMYFLGIFIAIPLTWIFKRTMLKSKTPPFMIELPPYRMPLAGNILHRVYERAGAFVQTAGTIILAVSVIVWALSYYPRPSSVSVQYGVKAVTASQPYLDKANAANLSLNVDLDSIEATSISDLKTEMGEKAPQWLDQWEQDLVLLEVERNGEYIRQSYLGQMGKMIEPVVRPLGWDWRIGMAALASFPAREVVVSTLGIIFNQGGEVDEETNGFIQTLQNATWPDGRKLFNLPVALSIMVFFALCMQCAATIATIRQETNSWRWPLFSFAYMTVLAYVGSMITYHLFSALMG